MADISQVLGDFMLKGYVLTNQLCPTRGCAVPILRTPTGKIPEVTFCVKCSDGGPSTPTSREAASKTPVSQSSSASRLSRSSTPPTEVSETSGSTSDFELPPETDDMRQRREQSDRASSEIGKRLLQGWTMLGDECPSDGCYGVPLVCPSRPTGTADLRKECVICRTIYKTKVDWAGRETLVPFNEDAVPILAPAPPTNHQRSPSLDYNLDNPVGNRTERKVNDTLSRRQPQPIAAGDILDEASEALQLSLQALASQLRKLSSSPNLDSKSIGMTADAMGKVTQTLCQVRQLS